ncbi:unnamed protein product [Miscanthus lutarioriparius]|uniref:RNase H type-1 domain-containing protein n=1 Tax=Miscanthus lutarioriparius TaxID=422564 RepID=A0A811PDC2_9POAL|nr:unnamed protein product [Miscanthus lutarioriparius]
MEFVNRSWDPGPGTGDLSTAASALLALQNSLKTWDRDVFGSIKQQVKSLRAELEAERSSTLYQGPTDRERHLVATLGEVLAREETMERQRSRIAWLKEGDRNTAFFQAKARARNRTNRIKLLKDEAGNEFTDQDDLERLACDCYQKLFAAQENLQPELICRHVPRKITPEMAAVSERPFSEQEVEEALFEMAPSKAPGVDGFNAGFFQTHWQLVKGCVVPAILGFLNGAPTLNKSVNKKYKQFCKFRMKRLVKDTWVYPLQLGGVLAMLSTMCQPGVLRGKYFPNGDFLTATKRRHCSETWRAILHGRDVLKKGLIMRIGPGEVDIWQDNWIPGLRPFRPLVHLPTAAVERVQDLFVPGTRVWDEQLVRRLFVEPEAAEILKIKPGMSLVSDVKAWAFEKHGQYLVRSAYRLLKVEQAAGETGASRECQHWQTVWKLDVPPKVRVFWWRVLHNSLPSKFELKRRHVAKESFCEYCGDPEETLYHVAIQCPLARRFWAELEFCNSKTAALVVCGAWTRTGRNARRHGRKTWEPGAAVWFVSTLLQELAAQKVPKEPRLPRRPEKWRSPEEGWIKVNTDAGFDTAACSGSCGVVIRDQTGLVKAVAARWLDDVPDALTAEAMAAKEGLELAAENGYDKVIFEVDCNGLKTLLDGDDGMRSAIGGLCFDITELGRSFVNFRVAWAIMIRGMAGYGRMPWMGTDGGWYCELEQAEAAQVLDRVHASQCQPRHA